MVFTFMTGAPSLTPSILSPVGRMSHPQWSEYPHHQAEGIRNLVNRE